MLVDNKRFNVVRRGIFTAFFAFMAVAIFMFNNFQFTMLSIISSESCMAFAGFFLGINLRITRTPPFKMELNEITAEHIWRGVFSTVVIIVAFLVTLGLIHLSPSLYIYGPYFFLATLWFAIGTLSIILGAGWVMIKEVKSES